MGGHDLVADAPLTSIQGHLGTVRGGTFSDIFTATLYFDAYKVPWDLQKTAFAYFAAVDQLTGSSLEKEFLAAFGNDGMPRYDDFGKKGIWGVGLILLGEYVSCLGTEPFGYLKGRFLNSVTAYRLSNAAMNPRGEDIMREFFYGVSCLAALQISQADMEAPDPFLPGLTFGKGKWPSFALASYFFLASALYGPEFPNKLGFPSLYGDALCYADRSQNGATYTGPIRHAPEPDGITRYIAEVGSGRAKPLDFTFYVPPGFESVGGALVPNVVATTEPRKVLTAVFAGGTEVWDRIAP